MYEAFGYLHWQALSLGNAARDRLRPLGDERGQGTVEYVGLILLVAVLMGGMVAALNGFSAPGKELAEAISKKIVQAVQKITFS